MTDTFSRASEAMIRLDAVSKSYPGQTTPAVSELSLDIMDGEIVVLVGPSGCGKTTTMRLINRLIEPTAGKIFLGGEDVTTVDADQLRRRIGYVIQQVGLFPHMSIANNIGLLLRALGWNKKEIRSRVDELLGLVGLDVDTYRDRYPKQLSGGQQQRVGVARALAADPPVMLMDEPFGAIDPITRERLQDELLGLQSQIRKTIVFVTHDIQEAIKLGDRIAIFAEGGRLAQYDTPAQILTNPADDFVASFIGGGAAVRGLGLERADSVHLEAVEVVRDASAAQTRTGSGRTLLVDAAGRPQRWLRPAASQSGDAAEHVAVVRSDQSLFDALDAMLNARDDTALVLGEHDQILGQLSWPAVVGRTARTHDDTVPGPDPEPATGVG